MSEELVDHEIRNIVEGYNVDMRIGGGMINSVAGEQIERNQYSTHTATNTEARRPEVKIKKGSATLAEGEHVSQHLSDCNVNIVAGDQIYYGNVYLQGSCLGGQGRSRTHSVPSDSSAHKDSASSDSRDRLTRTASQEKIKRRPEDNPPWVKLGEMVSGQHAKNFATKVNMFSSESLQGRILENYEDLSEPSKEFYPRMKTGFQLFKGDYVPQDGFSAHCQPKGGEYIDFKECMELIQEPRDKPCFIIGQPGSGKTIVMKRFAKALMITNQLYNHRSGVWDRISEIFRRKSRPYDVVLHINIRDIPNTKGTLAEILFKSLLTKLTTRDVHFGLQAILQKEIHAIMFFDGLDQASWEPKIDRKISDCWEQSNTANIFGNILAGNLMGSVPIVISSREHSVSLLSKEMRPQFIAALAGFSEEDAKSLYCELMGEGAENEWNIMQKSNPAMHSMCLTPLFLIFYAITKKQNAENPPDCATAVMVSIIQIFLESDNTRRIDNKIDVVSLFNKLKKMAYHGTKQQRVVFYSEDLQHFDLLYDEISDIVIKVPGLSILGQKILDGMFRFFFSHQTLQEILTALHVVGMDYENFKNLVDEDFQKRYWSVVRSFTCGLLKNDRVKARTGREILGQSTGYSEEKSEYLMKHLQMHLHSSLSTADKLETFVALKEANALEILQGLAEDFDFSSSSFTPSLINILCSVMKYVEIVPRLSLANSGLNDALLEALARGAEGLKIKIGIFDLKGNPLCKNLEVWRPLFHNLLIYTCVMDMPCVNETDLDVDKVLKLISAAAYANVCNLSLIGGHCEFKLQIQQIREYDGPEFAKVSKFKVMGLVGGKDFQDWKKLFQHIRVFTCFMEIECNDQNVIDVEEVLGIIDASGGNVGNFDFGNLYKMRLCVEQFRRIVDFKVGMKVPYLYIQPQKKDLEIWRKTFREMSFMVDRCFIEIPEPVEDLKQWVVAAKIAEVDNVTEVLLRSTNKLRLTMDDVKLLSKSKCHGEISTICFEPGDRTIDINILRETFRHTLIKVEKCFVKPIYLYEMVIDVRAWIAIAHEISGDNVGSVLLESTNGVEITIEGMDCLNRSGLQGKISELWIEPNRATFDVDVWQKTFQEVALNIGCCFMKPPCPVTREVDVSMWIAAAKATMHRRVKEVFLKARDRVSLTIADIRVLNTSKLNGEIPVITLNEKQLTRGDLVQLGLMTDRFSVTCLYLPYASTFPFLRSFVIGCNKVKIQRMYISGLDSLHLYLLPIKIFGVVSKVFLEISMSDRHMLEEPQDLGRYISQSDFKEVVISNMCSEDIDISSFASGLHGFKIKFLAVDIFNERKLLQLVSQCNVEQLFLKYSVCKQTFDALKRHSMVGILSKTEWNVRYLR